jgi:glutathione S-transferase
MKLYHCAHTRSVRVLWTLEELALDYELEVLPFPPRVFQKSYKEINPLGTVPFFVDGEVQMTESVAICHYLVDRYGPTALALTSTEKDYGDYLNWLYYSDATITFPQAIVLRYTQLEPPERRSQQVVDDYLAFLAGRLRKLESALENRDYLCAGRFTIADICVGFALFFAREVLQREDIFTANISRYYQILSKRPAFIKASEGKL